MIPRLNYFSKTIATLALALAVRPIAQANPDVLSTICQSSRASVNDLAADPLLKNFFEQTCGVRIEVVPPPVSQSLASVEAIPSPGLTETDYWQSQVTAEPPARSMADPWRYALEDIGLEDVEFLPTPTLLIPDWQQGLRPPTIPGWKPPRFHPQAMGLFLEFSGYRYAEDARPQRFSTLPSVGVSFRDERVISAPSQYFGISGNLDFTLGYTQFSRGGVNRNHFQKFQAEAYLPIGVSGLYWGLGYRRLLDDAGPGLDKAGFPEIDRLSEYQYLPIGWVSQSASGTRTKIQFNHVFRGDQTDYYGQISGYSGSAQMLQRRGYGLDLGVSGLKGWEFFARYWKLQPSRVGGVTANGAAVQTQTGTNETIELGVRKQLQ